MICTSRKMNKYSKLKSFKLQNAVLKYFLECTRCKTMIYYNISKYFQFGPPRQIEINQLANIKIQIQAKKLKIPALGIKKENSSPYIFSSNKLIVFCQCCSNNNKITYLGEIVARQVSLTNQINFVFLRSDKNLIQTKIIYGKKFKKEKENGNKKLSIDNLQYLVKSFQQINLKRIKNQLIRLLLYWQKLLLSKILQTQRKIEINSFYQMRMMIFKNFYQSLNKNKIKKKKRDSVGSKESNSQVHQIEI